MIIAAILTLLLIPTLSISSAYPSLQHESSIKNTGSILDLDNFARTIFFEYGAESETLDSWDWVGTWGAPETKIEFEDVIVHSGRKSLKFTTDLSSALQQGYSQPRAQLNWHGGLQDRLNLQEVYISYWIYLPNNYVLSAEGWDMAFDFHWRIAGEGWYNLPKVYIKKSTTNPPFVLQAPPSVAGNWTRSTKAIPRNQWVHFQMYYKLGVSDGVYRVWQDDQLIFDYTNVDTATTSNGVAQSIGSIEFKLYPSIYDPDTIVKYVDTIVISSEKVPRTYEVMNH